MKVSELMDKKLDYWAGKAQGRTDLLLDENGLWEPSGHGGYNPSQWSPSTDWAQGGPLIEKYGIDTTVVAESCYGDDLPNAKRAWRAERDEWDEYWGKTPLEAAMRCYVASKFGEEVPDE